MDKQILQNHIDNNLSIRQIAQSTGKSYTTVKYWLKKHELTTNHSQFAKKYNTEQERLTARRKQLVNSVTKRRKKLKEMSVEYLGGKCSKCGYNKCIAALEFHHLGGKDFGIAQSGHTRSWSKVKTELDKCVLLCSNCHREEHHLNN